VITQEAQACATGHKPLLTLAGHRGFVEVVSPALKQWAEEVPSGSHLHSWHYCSAACGQAQKRGSAYAA